LTEEHLLLVPYRALLLPHAGLVNFLRSSCTAGNLAGRSDVPDDEGGSRCQSFGSITNSIVRWKDDDRQRFALEP